MVEASYAPDPIPTLCPKHHSLNIVLIIPAHSFIYLLYMHVSINNL